ncbi:MAG: phosphohydrolase, partial [Oscillospiraceae bacterium]|nr:phosphohydrolase [Oscillospiraceae bacterium]
ALRNADRDFELNDTERDMIKKHMFPLNPTPPRFKETAVLCLADKYCALRETVLQRKKANK